MDPGANTGHLLEGQYDFHERWRDAVKHCKKLLGPDDFALIERYDDPRDMLSAVDAIQNSAVEGSVPRLLRQFRPRLLRLRDFSMGIALGVGMESVGIAAIWGAMILMLELAIRSDEVLQEIVAMWADIATSIQIFDSYQSFIEKDIAMQEAQFDILVELLLFTVTTIQTVKGTRAGTHFLTAGNWTKLKGKFRTTSDKISSQITFIKARAEAEMLKLQLEKTTEDMDRLALKAKGHASSLQNSALQDSAKLPCYYVPFPVNPNFFGRSSVLETLHKSLTADPSSYPIKSVALWAAAGVGKTQIALSYAGQQRDAGVEAIFWIRSENESEMARSLTEIAETLELSGAATSFGHDQNRLLVRQWLQQTKVPWLLIFDNLESLDLLKDVRPACGTGSILMTCRSELLAASAASTAMEVLTFSEDDGASLLLKQVGSGKISDEDRQLAKRIAKGLGGHALAIDVVARYMRSRRKKLEDVAHDIEFENSPWQRTTKRGIMNMYYDHNYDYAWRLAFEQLAGNATDILGILCMLAPDKIPEDLLTNTNSRCGFEGFDPYELEDIVLELRDLSLAKYDPDPKMLSVHRLISTEFRKHIGPAACEINWKKAIVLLHHAFPQQTAGFTLYNQWKTCEGLIEHVETLCHRFQELNRISPGQMEFVEDFVYLVSDASRYLYEIGRYNTALELLDSGFLHCKDRESLPYSNLCTVKESVLCDRGLDKEAMAYNKQVLAIRQKLLPPDHPEIANALSNWAMTLTGMGQDLEMALQMLQQALNIDTKGPEENARQVMHLRHYNLCFAYNALGRHEEAKRELDKATELTVAEFGPDSVFLNITYRLQSRFLCASGQYEEAFDLLDKAHTIALEQNATNYWVSTSLYKMGNIRFHQKQYTEAETLLRRAAFIAQINAREKGDEGDVARIYFHLSKVLESLRKTDESSRFRVEAERIYEDLMDSGQYTQSDDPEQKWEYLVNLILR